MPTKAMARPGLVIPKPDFQWIELSIEGTAPLMIHKFSTKAQTEMRATQEAGSQAKSKSKRDPKDFESLCDGARHISTEGWDGIHAGCFRNAAISACRTAGYVMTKAKLAIFIECDGYDAENNPLVRIQDAEGNNAVPVMSVMPCRNATGVIDLRARPTYNPWFAKLKVKFDNGMLSQEDVTNLMQRVGLQVGVGEGRPDSRQSAGIGYGLFRIH